MNNYMLLSVVFAIISLVPFFVNFERKKYTSREVVITAVMIALTITSRMIFAIIPHFKPVTALVIIIGVCFGADCGFLTGSVSALLSNFYYGQGPWTVFQMLSWGLIGFLSGKLKLNNKVTLLMFSGLSGVLYSIIMDLYTTLSMDMNFSFTRYITYIATSLPIMAEYVISNIVFILVLYKPITKKLQRFKAKYGIFSKTAPEK